MPARGTLFVHSRKFGLGRVTANGDFEPLLFRAGATPGRHSRSPQRRRGRPKWVPGVLQRSAIREAARRGLSQDIIAALVGVSESTLKRRCGEELRIGALLANAQIALTAYELGVSGKDPAMTRWWLRVRMGWR